VAVQVYEGCIRHESSFNVCGGGFLYCNARPITTARRDSVVPRVNRAKCLAEYQVIAAVAEIKFPLSFHSLTA
jgi:hypothetical protein